MNRFLLSMALGAASLMSAQAAEVYELVTDASSLQAGDQVIIAYVAGATGNYAMGTQAAKYFNRQAVTITNNQIVDPQTADPSGADFVRVVTLEESGNTDYPWHLKVATGEYLYSKSAANELYTTTVGPNSETTGACAKIEADGNAMKISLNREKSNKNYQIQYNANSGQERFSCYTGTQKNPSLFRLVTEEKLVETPVISLIEGDYGFSLQMTCATEGAEIRYTTDGTNPTATSTLYNAPFEVWESMTVKAVGIKDGNLSNVATLNVAPPYILESFMPLSDFEPEANQTVPVIVKGNMTAVYQNGSNLYAKASDGSWMLIFGSLGKTLANGDTFNRLEGDFFLYNGLPEIQNPVIGDVTTGGTPVEPYEVADLSMIGQNMLNWYVSVSGVSISDFVASTKNGTLTDGEANTMVLRNNFGIDIIEGDNLTVTGFVAIYKGTLQFYPTAIVEKVETPELTLIEGDYGFTVGITCATEGAEIRYTTDGSTPTETSMLYTAPVEVWEACTVKAIAFKNGVASEVASLDVNPPYILDTFMPLLDFPVEDGQTVPVIINSRMTVVYQNGANLYVRDSSGSYMLVYGTLEQTLSNGDTFSRLEGQYTMTDGLPQLISPVIGGEIEAGTAVAPAELDELSLVAQNVLNWYVTFSGITVTDYDATAGTATITDAAGTSVALLDKFGITVKEGVEYTMTGFVGISGETIQFYPTEITGGYVPVDAPTFSIADGETVYAGTSIEITAAEGTEIYVKYLNDDFVVYTEPIVLETAGTAVIEAYAKKDGVVSETVKATYTVVDKPSSLTSVEAATDADAIYFDLSGRRVSNPTPGLYIRISGSKAEKVMVK